MRGGAGGINPPSTILPYKERVGRSDLCGCRAGEVAFVLAPPPWPAEGLGLRSFLKAVPTPRDPCVMHANTEIYICDDRGCIRP